MAHTLFDIFPVLDSQTTIAVQSLLESQTVSPESSSKNGTVSLDVNLDDDDVLQCGKCKKQFSSLVSFISHKRDPCRAALSDGDVLSGEDGAQPTSASGAVPFEGNVCDLTHSEVSTPYTSDAPSSLPQITHSVVLNEAEFLSLTGIEPSSLSLPVNRSFATVEQTDPCISMPSLLSHSTSLSMSGSTLIPTRLSNPTVFTMAPMKGPTAPLFTKAFTPICATDLDRCQTQFGCSSKGGARTLSLNQNALVSIAGGDVISSAEMKEIGNMVTYSIVAELQPISERELGTLGVVEVHGDVNGITNAIEKALNNEPPTPPPPPLPSLKAKKQGAAEGNTKSEAVGKKALKLQCAYCEKGFTKNFDLQQHIRSHTGEKPFQCIVCGRAFAQKSNVKKHMQTHKVWPVGLSHTLPNQRDDRRRHRVDQTVLPHTPSSDPDDPIYEKNQDLSQSPVQNDKVEASKTEGDELKLKVVLDSSYVCQYCNETFKTYCMLKTHLNTHKNEQVYKCIMKACGQTFHELNTFLEHAKTHENEMVYRCHLCNKTFPSLFDLGLHQYTHNAYPDQTKKPGPRCYRCTKCLNKYATPEALDHHMTTTTHSYPCSMCDKVFSCERYLRRHLPTHCSIGRHSCPECHKHFKTDHYLKMHRLIHSGEKPFCCTECQASFNRKDKLKRHLLIHNPVKHYKCPFRSYTGCNKEFHRPDKLKAHILTHSGLKPYKCRHCGGTFSRPSHLREHEQLHGGSASRANSKFSCRVCKARFASNKALLEHICGSATTLKENRKSSRSIQPKRGRVAKKLRGCFVSENEKSAAVTQQQQLKSSGAGGETESKREQRLQRRARQRQQSVQSESKARLDDSNGLTCVENDGFVEEEEEEDRLERRALDSSADFPEVHVTADDLQGGLEEQMARDTDDVSDGQRESRLLFGDRPRFEASVDNEMTLEDMNTLDTVLRPLVAVDPSCGPSLSLAENEALHSQVVLLPCEMLLDCQPVIVSVTTDDDDNDDHEMNS